MQESAVSAKYLLKNIVSLCIDVSGKYSAPPVFVKILNNLLTTIENLPSSGKPNEQAVAAATGTSPPPNLLCYALCSDSYAAKQATTRRGSSRA